MNYLKKYCIRFKLENISWIRRLWWEKLKYFIVCYKKNNNSCIPKIGKGNNNCMVYPIGIIL